MRLIDADVLKVALHNFFDGKVIDEPAYILRDVFCHIDSAKEIGYEDGVLSVESATRRAIELEEAYNNGWSDGFSEGENERPQGEWIIEKNKFGDILHCSICGARPRRSEYGYDLHDKFCNECGADMRKGGAE